MNNAQFNQRMKEVIINSPYLNGRLQELKLKMQAILMQQTVNIQEYRAVEKQLLLIESVLND